MIRVVNDDLILLGMARAPGNEVSSSLLRAVDSNGNQLWQLNGLGGFQQEGQLDQNPFLVQPDAEVLSRNRIVSFYSYSDPEMGADGAVRVLDTEGNTLHSVNQHELGLVRIFDSAVLGEQIVLVGNTADKTRILILNDALAVVRQQDFAKAEFGRLAADHDTLCFALLSGVSWNDFVVADGAALLGVMTSKGKTWSTSRVGAALLDVTLNADNGRCAYTNSIIDGESGNESLARSNFVVYSSKGIEAESKISGISRGFPLVPGFTPHALLRGHHLINLTTDVIWEEESEGEEEPEGRYIARLQKHFVH
jgi:hypothetical protein